MPVGVECAGRAALSLAFQTRSVVPLTFALRQARAADMHLRRGRRRLLLVRWQAGPARNPRGVSTALSLSLTRVRIPFHCAHPGSAWWCQPCTACLLLRHLGMGGGKYSMTSPTGSVDSVEAAPLAGAKV